MATVKTPDTRVDAVDGARLDPRWFHPVLAGAWLAVFALLPAATGLSPWWLCAGLLVTWVARAAVKVWVAPGTHGAAHYGRTRTFVTVAGVTATAWLVWAGHTIGDRAGRAVGVLALWMVVFGCGYAILRTRAPQHAEQARTEQAEVAAVRREAQVYTEATGLWEPWLERVDLSGVEVEQAVETLAGYTLYLATGLDGDGQLAKFTQLTAALPALAALASRHYGRHGIEIAVDQIRAEETAAAHQWLLHVDTKQPLKKSIPHPGDTGAGSILEPAILGMYQDGTAIEVMLCGIHGVMVGATGSGKSVCLNCVIAAVTRCPDAELWVGATAKLMPVIWPWLSPWLTGKTARPVIQRVAGETLPEVLLMLADLYKIVKLRNRRLGPNSKHRPTRLDPAFVGIVDEATDLAKDKTSKVTTFDGREWTGAALFDAIASKGRSACVSLLFWTQYGLMDALGDHGNKTMRNLTLRIAARTESVYDGQATLRGMRHVDTTKLRDHKILVQPNSDVPRVIPGKTFELDGEELIHALAVAHTRYRPDGLPDWLVEELGGSYTERWHAWRQPTLVEACEFAGIPYPIPDPRTAGDDTIDDSGSATATDSAARMAPPDPTGPLNGATAPGTIRPVTTTTTATAADVHAAHDALSARLAEVREYGPLGRVFTSVFRAFQSERAPQAAPVSQLVIAAKLAAPDAPDTVFDPAQAQMLRVLAHYGVTPTDNTAGGESVIRRADILTAWDTAKAAVIASQQQNAPADQVLAAVDGMPDNHWIGVGELGVRAGHIAPGDDMRDAARQFSQYLRDTHQLPDTAFKRASSGTVVNVGALRAARHTTAA